MKKAVLSLFGIIILALAAGYLWEAAQRYAGTRHPFPISTPEAGPEVQSMKETFIKTKDGVDIAADYYPAAAESQKGAILLHMMPATRSSWRPFAPKLQELGYHVIAIDLRGHGESSGGPDGYKNFSDADHQKSILDIESALAFLEEKGAKSSQLVVIGASIGANLAVQFIAQHSDIPKAVLLSPGLNYRGIQAGVYIENLRPGQSILLVGSNDDAESRGAVMQNLADGAPGGVDKKVLVYKEAGHGTNMLAPHRAEGSGAGFGKEAPDLAEEILNWLGK